MQLVRNRRGGGGGGGGGGGNALGEAPTSERARGVAVWPSSVAHAAKRRVAAAQDSIDFFSSASRGSSFLPSFSPRKEEEDQMRPIVHARPRESGGDDAVAHSLNSGKRARDQEQQRRGRRRSIR